MIPVIIGITLALVMLTIVFTHFYYITSRKTAGNVWETEDKVKFIIIGYSMNRDAPYPIHIKHTNREWLDWWAIDDSRFHRYLGTKKKYPEYFL